MIPVSTTSPATTKLKFRLAGGGQPLMLVPVNVNGRGPFEFILDTGAGTCLVNTPLARSLAVETTGAKQGHTAGGAIDVQLATLHSLSVGDIVRQDVDVGIADLSPIARAVGSNVDGDLGYNFLKHFRLRIDFRTFELKLEDPKRVESFGTDARADLPIRLAQPSKPLILIGAHVNGRGPFHFAVDTGTSTTAITPEIARDLGLPLTPIGAATTGGAQIPLKAARLATLRVGSAERTDIDVIVGEFLAMLSKVAGSQLDGIIGYNFLQHYRVTIDYPNETLRLE